MTGLGLIIDIIGIIVALMGLMKLMKSHSIFKYSGVGFLVGLVIGAFCWIVSSSILRPIIGYALGGKVGMVLGSLMIAGYSSYKTFEKIEKMGFIAVFFICIFVFSFFIWQPAIDAFKLFGLSSESSGFAWAFAWMISWACVGALVGVISGLTEEFKNENEA